MRAGGPSGLAGRPRRPEAGRSPAKHQRRQAVGHRTGLLGAAAGFRPAAAAADRSGRPAGNYPAGHRAARAQPAGASDADLQRHRRAGAVPAAIGFRPLPPPRWRVVRAVALDLSDHAFLHRKPAHRRGSGARHGNEHFAERQPAGVRFAAALWCHILRRPPQRAFSAKDSRVRETHQPR